MLYKYQISSVYVCLAKNVFVWHHQMLVHAASNVSKMHCLCWSNGWTSECKRIPWLKCLFVLANIKMHYDSQNSTTNPHVQRNWFIYFSSYLRWWIHYYTVSAHTHTYSIACSLCVCCACISTEIMIICKIYLSKFASVEALWRSHICASAVQIRHKTIMCAIEKMCTYWEKDCSSTYTLKEDSY